MGMKRYALAAAWAVGGIALAVGLTFSAYAVAGKDLSTPTRPVDPPTPLVPQDDDGPAPTVSAPELEGDEAGSGGSGEDGSSNSGSGSDSSGSGSGSDSSGSGSSGSGSDSDDSSGSGSGGGDNSGPGGGGDDSPDD